MSRHGILAEIIEHKRAETRALKAVRPLAAVRRDAEDASPARPFAERLATDRPAVIAEIKKASPSEGVIREDFDPQTIATDYASAKASCLSVLTDERFFQGDDAHLVAARAACTLPVLRKDFIVDEYQVYETRALGADCLLLIVAALEPSQLADLNGLAQDIGLDVLIEAHDRAELQQALALGPRIVGINNRDLATFTTRLETTLDLLDDMPDDVGVVTESGIHTPQDVCRMIDAGVNAFLVGTAFMREASPGAALQRLFGWAA
ncbi:MAG: indole-3-glycerol phosphate synthase TrpC [Gammaproteobacteria bacterium]|nr:indole-3-glycerol phosphate synthase TrpC [Gammaproteobacteria bacterium]